MPRRRPDPREEPRPQSAAAVRRQERAEQHIPGLYVNGVQPDAARAARNRAMIARMRAGEEPTAAETVAAQEHRTQDVWATVDAEVRARRQTEEGLRAWARLRADWGTLPALPDASDTSEEP